MAEPFRDALRRYIASGYRAADAMRAVWQDVKIGRVARPRRRHAAVRAAVSLGRRRAPGDPARAERIARASLAGRERNPLDLREGVVDVHTPFGDREVVFGRPIRRVSLHANPVIRLARCLRVGQCVRLSTGALLCHDRRGYYVVGGRGHQVNPLTRHETAQLVQAERTALRMARRLPMLTAPERQDPVSRVAGRSWAFGRADAFGDTVRELGAGRRGKVRPYRSRLGQALARRNPELTAHERAEFSRAASAMYARGENALGHLLSAVAAVKVAPLAQYDRAAAAYRQWLVFDQPSRAGRNPSPGTAWRRRRGRRLTGVYPFTNPGATLAYYAWARRPDGRLGQLLVKREGGRQVSQTWTGTVYRSDREAAAAVGRLNLRLARNNPRERAAGGARYLFGAIWPSGETEVFIGDQYEALRRRELATGLGGPRRIVTGKLKASTSDVDARAAALTILRRNPATSGRTSRRRQSRVLSVPEQHQLRIAAQTLRMPAAMVGVMGGMTTAQARQVTRRLRGNPVAGLPVFDLEDRAGWEQAIRAAGGLRTMGTGATYAELPRHLKGYPRGVAPDELAQMVADERGLRARDVERAMLRAFHAPRSRGRAAVRPAGVSAEEWGTLGPSERRGLAEYFTFGERERAPARARGPESRPRVGVAGDTFHLRPRSPFKGQVSRVNPLSAGDPQIQAFLTAWHEAGRPSFERAYTRLDYDSPAYQHVARERKKYIALDHGTGGVFLVDKVTGDVFTIKAYGVPKRRVGTLAELTAQYRGGQRINPLPTRTGATMGEAIALSSPSGRLSTRARARATERLRVELFGPQGLERPTAPQPRARATLLRTATQLRELAARGLQPRAYLRRAETLERQAAALPNPGETWARWIPTKRQVELRQGAEGTIRAIAATRELPALIFRYPFAWVKLPADAAAIVSWESDLPNPPRARLTKFYDRVSEVRGAKGRRFGFQPGTRFKHGFPRRGARPAAYGVDRSGLAFVRRGEVLLRGRRPIYAQLGAA